MNILADFKDNHISDKLRNLRNTVNKSRKSALRQRINTKPHPSDLEYQLGAFIEMYEPHLENFVYKLSQKGYAIDQSSGFGIGNAQFQSICGNFSINFMEKNKLEKIGVKFRDYNGFNSITFWPKEATLPHIISRWTQIVETLPDHGMLKRPSMSDQAVKFRRKYIPERSSFQKQRLFEKLRYSIQRKSEIETKKRIRNNPRPKTTEFALGLFLEEIDSQVRMAVLKLYQKGYSIDASGFMNDPCDQMIEGDFQLDEKTVIKLTKIGVDIETNPSRYTRIKFTPQEADFTKIRNTWNKIASVIPDKHSSAFPSMIRKARTFRTTYQ